MGLIEICPHNILLLSRYYLRCIMGGSASQLQERHVVVIGGGYAGVAVANRLRGKCQMTLIDPKECMHHCVGGLRAVVEPGEWLINRLRYSDLNPGRTDIPFYLFTKVCI